MVVQRIATHQKNHLGAHVQAGIRDIVANRLRINNAKAELSINLLQVGNQYAVAVRFTLQFQILQRIADRRAVRADEVRVCDDR